MLKDKGHRVLCVTGKESSHNRQGECVAWLCLSSPSWRMTWNIWLGRIFPLEYLIEDMNEVHMVDLSYMVKIVHVYTNLWTDQNPDSKTIMAPSILEDSKDGISHENWEGGSRKIQVCCTPCLFLCAQSVLGMSWDRLTKSVFQFWVKPTSQGC